MARSQDPAAFHEVLVIAGHEGHRDQQPETLFDGEPHGLSNNDQQNDQSRTPGKSSIFHRSYPQAGANPHTNKIQ